VTGLIGKRNREKVTFATETATIGIRGTHFGALLCQNDCGGVPTTSGAPPANGLHVDVTSGAITLSNAAGTIQLNPGQFGFAANANSAPVPVPPQQGVSVTMPSSISKDKSGGRGIGKGDDSECKMKQTGQAPPAPTLPGLILQLPLHLRLASPARPCCPRS
jgi:hypothetical protein